MKIFTKEQLLKRNDELVIICDKVTEQRDTLRETLRALVYAVDQSPKSPNGLVLLKMRMVEAREVLGEILP